MTRSKAFFLNGGAGRMLCSIPALELYEQESGDKDFVIVCEGGTDMFKVHPKLHKLAFVIFQEKDKGILCLHICNLSVQYLFQKNAYY